jgi:hypothetical protein
LRIRRVGTGLPRVRHADPDCQSRLIDVEVHADGDFAVAELPAPRVWQLVLIDPERADLERAGPEATDPERAEPEHDPHSRARDAVSP